MRKLRTGAGKVGGLVVSVARGIDARDVMGAAGLAALGYGVSLMHYPAAFIITGAILVGVAIFGTRG